MSQSGSVYTQRRWFAGLIRRIGSDRLLLISVLVTVTALVLLLVLYQVIVRVSGAANNIESWSLLDGVMSMITLAVIMGGGLFALTEYIEGEEERRQATSQQQFSLYDSLVARMMNPEEIEIRRWVIQNIPIYQRGENFDEWTRRVREIIFARQPGEQGPAIGHHRVKSVLNTFDYLGFVAINYWDLDGPLMDWMNPMITKVWDRIGPYIEEESRRRDEPDYYKWAREFGQRCCEWRAGKNLPEPAYVDYAL